MNRRPRSPRFPSFRPEGLESRAMLAAGISSGLNVVMELGEVSRGAALKGVEVAAPIPSHGSITFVFSAEEAGNYLLKVRHLGDDLTLEARGPSGSASVDPGPAGPFETLSLALKAAEYRITASAAGDQPAFVDWELLLTQGVGQSAAIGATVASPSTALPPSAPPGPASPSATPSSTPSSTPSTNWGGAVSPSMVAIGGLAGRSEPGRAITLVGPTSLGGRVALAHAGDGLPIGALKALAPVATEDEGLFSLEATPLLTLEVLGDARQDLAALGPSTWLDRLAEFQAGPTLAPIGPDSPVAPAERAGNQTIEAVAVAAGETLAEESAGSTNLASPPGLFAVGVIAAAIARRWTPCQKLLTRSRKSPMRASFLPRSMN